MAKEFRVSRSRVGVIVKKVMNNQEALEEVMAKRNEKEYMELVIENAAKTLNAQRVNIDSIKIL